MLGTAEFFRMGTQSAEEILSSLGYILSFLFFMVPEMEPRAWRMLGAQSATELPLPTAPLIFLLLFNISNELTVLSKGCSHQTCFTHSVAALLCTVA